MFPHSNIHKYNCTSPGVKTHKQIDHVLIDKWRHLDTVDVRTSRRANCDTDHYQLIGKLDRNCR